MDEPGTIALTGGSWDANGSWKRRATPTGVDSETAEFESRARSDTRNERVDVPQYQYESDRLAAESDA